MKKYFKNINSPHVVEFLGKCEFINKNQVKYSYSDSETILLSYSYKELLSLQSIVRKSAEEFIKNLGKIIPKNKRIIKGF